MPPSKPPRRGPPTDRGEVAANDGPEDPRTLIEVPKEGQAVRDCPRAPIFDHCHPLRLRRPPPLRWGLHRLVTVERIGVRLGPLEHAAAIYAGRVAIAAARYRLHPPPRHRPAERVIRAAARRESAAGPERTYCDGEDTVGESSSRSCPPATGKSNRRGLPDGPTWTSATTPCADGHRHPLC